MLQLLFHFQTPHYCFIFQIPHYCFICQSPLLLFHFSISIIIVFHFFNHLRYWFIFFEHLIFVSFSSNSHFCFISATVQKFQRMVGIEPGHPEWLAEMITITKCHSPKMGSCKKGHYRKDYRWTRTVNLCAAFGF